MASADFVKSIISKNHVPKTAHWFVSQVVSFLADNERTPLYAAYVDAVVTVGYLKKKASSLIEYFNYLGEDNGFRDFLLQATKEEGLRNYCSQMLASVIFMWNFAMISLGNYKNLIDPKHCIPESLAKSLLPDFLYKDVDKIFGSMDAQHKSMQSKQATNTFSNMNETTSFVTNVGVNTTGQLDQDENNVSGSLTDVNKFQ